MFRVYELRLGLFLATYDAGGGCAMSGELGDPYEALARACWVELESRRMFR